MGGYEEWCNAWGVEPKYYNEPSQAQKDQWAAERAAYVAERTRTILLNGCRIQKFIESSARMDGVETLDVLLDPSKPDEFPDALVPYNLSRESIKYCIDDLEFFCEWSEEAGAWVPKEQWSSIWQEKMLFCRKWSQIEVKGERYNFPLAKREGQWYAQVNGQEFPVHLVEERQRKYKPPLGHWELGVI